MLVKKRSNPNRSRSHILLEVNMISATQFVRPTNETPRGPQRPSNRANSLSSSLAIGLSFLLMQLAELSSCTLQTNAGNDSNLKTINHRQASSTFSQASIESKHNGTSSLRLLQASCATSINDLDSCSAQLIGVGSTINDYPSNPEEFDTIYCPTFKRAVSCVRQASACLSRFERQVVEWVLHSSRRMNNKRCKDDAEKQRFLRLTNSCYRQARSPMNNCMDHYIASLESIAEISTPTTTGEDIQIQLSCCANRQFKDCIMNDARQACKQDYLKKLRRANSNSAQRAARKHLKRAQSNNDMMDDLKATLDGMALTGPEFICNSVSENFCRQNYDSRYTLNRIPRYKSILPSMIKIYVNK